MIILITASLSWNTYNKASWREDWTFEGTSMLFNTSILLWDLWCLWSSLSGFPDRSETRETFPRTETIRSHSSRAGKTIQSQSSVQRDDFRFCLTVRNSSLFLAYPTYWNKRTTSPNAQCSSRSGFWIFKISCEVRVLKQSQSALFGTISHMTMLFVFTSMMNIWNQSIQAFETSLGPFFWWIVRACLLTIEYQVVQFLPSISISEQIWEHTCNNSPNRFHFFFFEVVVIDAWSRYFVELLSRLFCQLTISFHTLLCITNRVTRPWRNTKILREW